MTILQLKAELLNFAPVRESKAIKSPNAHYPVTIIGNLRQLKEIKTRKFTSKEQKVNTTNRYYHLNVQWEAVI